MSATSAMRGRQPGWGLPRPNNNTKEFASICRASGATCRPPRATIGFGGTPGPPSPRTAGRREHQLLTEAERRLRLPETGGTSAQSVRSCTPSCLRERAPRATDGLRASLLPASGLAASPRANRSGARCKRRSKARQLGRSDSPARRQAHRNLRPGLCGAHIRRRGLGLRSRQIPPRRSPASPLHDPRATAQLFPPPSGS